MEEQQVRNAIQALIERKDKRIGQLVAANKTELRASERMENEMRIVRLEHGVNTLIELQHNLQLCDCPDEAYATQEEQVQNGSK